MLQLPEREFLLAEQITRTRGGARWRRCRIGVGLDFLHVTFGEPAVLAVYLPAHPILVHARLVIIHLDIKS